VPELTEDQTRAALAGLRAETLPLIRPPGSVEAARTVRRRRRAGAAAIALGVVAAIAAGALVQTVVRTGQPAPPVAPASAPTATRLSDGDIDDLIARAKTLLELDNVDNRRRKAEGKGSIISHVYGALTVTRGPRMGASGYSENASGIYVIDVVCLGTGSMRLNYWAGAHDVTGTRPPTPPPGSSSVVVPCGPETVTTVRVLAPRPQVVYHHIAPDEAADGRAVYALRLRLLGRDES
jgi:hypothetical protein